MAYVITDSCIKDELCAEAWLFWPPVPPNEESNGRVF